MKLLRSLLRRLLASCGYEIRRRTRISGNVEVRYLYVAKLLYLRRMFGLVEGVDGDVVECGLAQGKSFLMFAFLIKDEMKGRKLWGFDSFEGFPEPSKNDASIRGSRRGDFGDTSVLAIQELLRRSELDRQFVKTQVTIVKGFLADSLPKYRGPRIALLHLDVDLYESYVTALKELYPRVTRGGDHV